MRQFLRPLSTTQPSRSVMHAGPRPVFASDSIGAADRADDRLEAAIAAGDSLDARIVLLALHSGVIVSEVADRFEVEID